MEIKAYTSEKFERSNWWYIIFTVIIATILFFSILSKNIVGAILIFFLLGGYFYYSLSSNQIIKIKITEDGIMINKKLYSRNILIGYVLEIDKETQIIKNIVFVSNKGHTTHTLADSKKNIKEFIINLNDHLPMLQEYNQSFIEKLSRALKL